MSFWRRDTRDPDLKKTIKLFRKELRSKDIEDFMTLKKVTREFEVKIEMVEEKQWKKLVKEAKEYEMKMRK